LLFADAPLLTMRATPTPITTPEAEAQAGRSAMTALARFLGAELTCLRQSPAAAD